MLITIIVSVSYVDNIEHKYLMLISIVVFLSNVDVLQWHPHDVKSVEWTGLWIRSEKVHIYHRNWKY